MGWFSSKPQALKLVLKESGRSIEVRSGETLLQAILGQGVEFPHLCRVGSCGTCKSKLTAGTAKTLVDLSYVLSVADIREGYLLPCQAIATSDCELSLPPAEGAVQDYDDLDAVVWPDSGGFEACGKTDP